MTAEQVIDWFDNSADGILRVKRFARQSNVSVDDLTTILEDLQLRTADRFTLQYDVFGVSAVTGETVCCRVPSRQAAVAVIQNKGLDQSNAHVELAMIVDSSRDATAQALVSRNSTLPIECISALAAQTTLRIAPATGAVERVYRTYSRLQMASGESLQPVGSTEALAPVRSAGTSSPPIPKPAAPPVVMPPAATASLPSPVPPKAVVPKPEEPQVSPIVHHAVETPPMKVTTAAVAPVTVPTSAAVALSVASPVKSFPRTEALTTLDERIAAALGASAAAVLQAVESSEITTAFQASTSAPQQAASIAASAAESAVVAPAPKPAPKNLMSWFKPKQEGDVTKRERDSDSQITASQLPAVATTQPPKKQPSAEPAKRRGRPAKQPAGVDDAAPTVVKEKAPAKSAKSKALFSMKATSTGAAVATNLGALVDDDADDDTPFAAMNDRQNTLDLTPEDDAAREARLYDEEQQRYAAEAPACEFVLGEALTVDIPAAALEGARSIPPPQPSPAPKRTTVPFASTVPLATASRNSPSVQLVGTHQPTLTFAQASNQPAVTALHARYKKVTRETTRVENGEFLFIDEVFYVESATGAEIDEDAFKKLLAEAAAQPAMAQRSLNTPPSSKLAPTKATSSTTAGKKGAAATAPPGTKSIANFFAKK